MPSLRRLVTMPLLMAALTAITGCGDNGEPEAGPTERPTPSEFVEGELASCFIPRTAATVEPATATGRGLRLPAAVISPPDESRAVMVLLHQTDGDGLCGWGDFASAAAEHGVASVAFDQCGYGSASCKIDDPDDPVPQVRAALELAQDRWPDARIVLVGASMGGSQTVRAVAGGVDVDGWVDLSGPSNWVGVDLASVADKIDVPGLVAMSEESDGADEADAAEALAESTGSEFVPADLGHGYELIVDRTLTLLPVGERVVDYALGF